MLLLGAQALSAERASADSCGLAANPIVCENELPGDPPSQWDVEGSGDPSIQGFATDISVDRGQTVHFKIKTDSSEYRLDIYRMGYYGGEGARRVASVEPSADLPQTQPPCEEEEETGLVDCGNWEESASWPVPADAVSGIYFAKLVREDQPSEGSHIVFVVRDDGGHSDLLFQTSDTTWQAYNRYGGNSLYEGGPGTDPDRAYKVSYNRPLTTRGPTPEDDPFSAEYPMVRWLERNGYDVSYFTGVDADRRGEEMLDHKVYLSVGHDEYWSARQRENVEAAREAGVNLAFFSGNEIFWKTRWEDSIDGSGTDHRTLVCYKETHANAKIDPEADVWTGTWRDPRFSSSTDGGKPENSLSGTLFTVDQGTTAIEVPAADGKLRLWRDTGLSSLAPGEAATLAEGTLGYEWDEDVDNGFRPPGLMDLSSTTAEVPQKLIDYGSNYLPGTATHHLTLYRAPSGALVFGAGTVQWSWGLDGEHDRGGSTPDPRMQQATVNLLADMGTQPGSIQGDLVATSQSTDTTPPSTTIGSPSTGSHVKAGHVTAISGTATDAVGETAGGQVAGVEVSTDGGDTWHPAEGRDQWSYTWSPEEPGSYTVQARAVDDSGNLEEPGDAITIAVEPPSCPCSIWDESLAAPEDPDPSAIEVGTKFRSDNAGYVTGASFYKHPGNTGVHVGRLWTADGTELAQATFTGETDSGWQRVTFDNPVPVEADTTYIVSYDAPHGHYSSLNGYFSLVGVDSPPLHALADGVDGGNGVFSYGPPGSLFAEGEPQSFEGSNYLVDVIFDEEVESDTTPPTLNGRAPSPGATDISTNAGVNATFDEAVDPSTVTAANLQLRDPSGDVIPASVEYEAAERQATLNPTAALEFLTEYTVVAKGGPGGIADSAGNPLAADVSWSFTTGEPPPPPPNTGPGGPILVISNSANPFSNYYAEILRTEGLNEFAVQDIDSVTASTLDEYDVAILGEGALDSGQASMLQEWVQQGGNLIAMRPDQQLAGLLGLAGAGGTLSNAYLKVDTGTAPGAGIVGQTIQFHGTADRFTPTDAETIATLYSNASTSTSNPAVTLRSVGSNGGHAAAFSYDLAKSVVYTRQGNPAWAGQERDGVGPIRSDDLFYGAKAGDPQPDWVNLEKVAIPQADEQQRLLTNLIERMNRDRKPLPRFWFLPRGEKAAVVMTGDDHGNGGTVGRFEQYEEESPPGCVVAEWQCIRSTSYIFPNTQIGNGRASEFTAAGFEIGLHTLTNCEDWTSRGQLEDFYSSQLEALAGNFPDLPAPKTNRTHCIAWSDWATQPKVELQNGIRLDTDYYYWPGSWVQDRPGMFTGSGMPMRFADLDGSMIDVYQAPTQMTDESEQTYPFTVDTLLDNALGPDGYYGVFTANMHTDLAREADSDAVVASAQAHGVPVVSAKQMLNWLDGRNRSSFGSIEWSGNRLGFTISRGAGANGLRAMVPVDSSVGELSAIERDGEAIPTTVETIKGIQYAFFDAAPGGYVATYADHTPPAISDVAASAHEDDTATISWSSDEPADSRVEYGTSPSMLSSSSSSPILVKSHSIQLTGLTPGVTYYYRVTSADASANSTTDPTILLNPHSFTSSTLTDTTPPETAIDSSPPALTNSPEAEFAFSASDGGSGVKGFECRRDDGDWTACDSPQTYASLADGAHSFEVRSVDNAGNADATPATFDWTVDTTAPVTAIDAHPPALTDDRDAQFEFSASDGGSGVKGFECRRDGEAWSGCDSPRSYASLADGSHRFEVRATDEAGNVEGAPAVFEWTIDTAAPTTTIDAHPPALTNGASADFEFSGADDSGSGIASFQCRRDAGDWTTCDSPQTYSSLADGPHEFEVRAIDKAGNVDATPASFAWGVDTAPPETELDSHPPAASNSSSAVFEFSASDGSGSGIASFECRRDGESWAACSSSRNYVSLADGPHEFEVRAVDKAGNADATPETFSWEIDTNIPVTAINAHPPALTANPNANFEFSGTDTPGSGIASFQCRRDGGDWAACDSPQTYASLSDGAHSFEVRAIDNAGNVDATPATFDWTVDTTAPNTQITDHPTSLTNSASAEFEFTGSDTPGSGVASFQCKKDGGDWVSCDSPQAYASLGDGAHNFEVRAVDNAGNVDATPATFDWTVDTTAPDTTITDHPPALTNSANANFEFSGTDTPGSGIASFQCRRDGGDWAACDSPQDYASLADGSHSFEVRAIDNAGNVDSTPATFGWTVDTTAPNTQIDSNPTALTANANANFEFSGADDSGSGIASFQCRRDAGDWTACDPPQTYASLSDGSHSFEVRAIDNAGNIDTTPATFSWTVDTTSPDTQITDHPTSLTNSASADFEFSGTDAPGSGIASFQCKKDGGEWTDCDSPQTYPALADGSHDFEVRAIDNAGNVDTTPATFSWTVDTTSPDTSITDHPTSLTNSADANFEFTGSDTPGSGVASFECKRDDGDWVSCDSPQDYASLADGSHSFEVRAIDQAGNTDASPATFGWTVDTTAPNTSITDHPTSLTNSASAKFEFSGTDAPGSGVASFQCRRDDGDWTACDSPQDYPSLSNGAHDFEVRAIDNAGNVDATPASFAWTVDTTAPDTQITDHPTSLTANANAKFEFSGSDAGSGVASFECRRDGGTWTACDSPQDYSSLADGAHSFEVRAIDNAGNVDSTPATFSWTVDTTAPNTQIDSNPTALTANASADFEFSGTDAPGSGIASFQCKKDGGEWTDCDSPQTYPVLADGSHSFEVRAIDNAGNTDATPATFSWTVDTTLPATSITDHPTSLTNSADANFEFSGSDAGSGVASFECRRDGGTWTACDSPQDYSSLADGAHSFEVRAIDQAGNVDASPAMFSWTVDTTAPETAIIEHPTALTNDATAKFEFSGTDPGGSGIASLQCKKDGGDWVSCDSPQAYASLTDGSHNFEVRAVDNAGNVDATPATFDWTIDTTRPVVTIDSGPSGLTNNPIPTFEFHSPEADISFECSLDTGIADFGACSGQGSHTPNHSLSDGSYSFRVRATDAAGNPTVVSQSFTVDTAAPSAPTLSETIPASPANDSSPKVFGSAPTGSTISIYATSDCSGSPLATDSAAALEAGITISVANDSSTALRASTTSPAGNVSACSSPLFYVEDSTSPVTQITDHPPTLNGSAAAVFEFDASDLGGSGVASFECKRDGGGWESCDSPQAYASLGDGAHNFEVRAVDNAGNVDATPATFGWTVDTTAPNTQITDHPTSLTANANAKFEFSGSDAGSGVASFECRRDGGTWTACDSPQTYASLTDGSHNFEVRAVDNAGNVDATPATFDWTVDTTSPVTTITDHPPALTNSANAKFEFSGADATGSGIASFQCKKDGGDWVSCDSPQAYASLSDGAYSFEVRAVDNAGNIDVTPASFAWTVDTTAPETAIIEHPTALTNDATAKFEFSGTDPGGSGIASLQCKKDGGDWTACDSPQDYASLADGSHSFEVRAVDNAGNVDATPATFGWTVDTTSPVTTITDHPPALTNSANAKFEFSGADATGSGIASFQCKKDGGDWVSCDSPQAYASLSDGAYSFEVRAIDNAGNVDSTPATFDWTVDTTAPDTQITDHPTSLTNSANADFEFSGSDAPGSGVASFQCKRDGGDWTACDSPQSYASLADGSHSFEVRAIDNAGNTDASPATFSWNVDTALPPSPTLSETVPASPANDNSPKVAGSATAGSTIRIYATADCSGPPLASGSAAELAAGVEVSVAENSSTTLRATATTTAGNTSPCSAPISYVEDSTAPDTSITDHPPALTNNADANFEFSGTDTPGSGIASFQCKRDGGDWTACDSPQDYASLADGAHSFEVRAIDNAGNVDSTPATFDWTVDTTAPNTQITDHPTSLTNSASAEFEFTGSDTPGSGVASFECKRDGGDWVSCDSPQDYASLSDGSHSFEVRAVDNAGNVDATPASFAWAVDTISPTISIDSLSRTLLGAGESAELNWHASESGSFELRLGGTDCTSGTVLASGPYGDAPVQHSTSIIAADLGEGANALRLCLTDAASNRGSATATLNKDTVSPDTTITDHPTSLTNSASANFEFSGTDTPGSGIASFQCKKDGGDWVSCDSPQDYASLADGAHSFEVRAIDNAGNTDASPATFSWNVDTALPPSPVLSTTVPASPANDNSPKVVGSAPAGSTIRIYATADCSGSTPLATGSAAELAAGIEVSVADDSNTALRATATSTPGNTSACSEPLTYVEDSTAPDTQIDLGPVALTNDPNTAFEFSGSDATGSGIASFQCKKDDGDWVACDSPETYASLSDGAHDFEVRAIDNAGNVDATPASSDWTIDTTPPVLTIDSGPSGTTDDPTPTFLFHALELGATFECSLSSDPAVFGACSGPGSHTPSEPLADGPYSFRVRASDAAGNQAIATRAFIVDTTSPEDGASTPAPGTVVTPSVNLPTNVFAFVRFVAVKYRAATVFLVFRVSGPGKLSANPPKATPTAEPRKSGAKSAADELPPQRIGAESVRATGAGQVRLPIKLTALGRQLLRQNGQLRVPVEFSFESIDGTSASRRMMIILKRKPHAARVG